MAGKAVHERERWRTYEKNRRINFTRRLVTSRNDRKIPLLTMLVFWLLSHLFYHSSSKVGAAVIEVPRSANTTSGADDIHRRCLGQFFANFNINTSSPDGDGDANRESHATEEGKNNEQNLRVKSMLNLFHEHTTCKLPSSASSPSNPSWKRKKKTNTDNGSLPLISNDEDRPYRVIMILTRDDPIYQDIITIASGLLVAGLEVTVFYIYQDDNDAQRTKEDSQRTKEKIRMAVLSRIPSSEDSIKPSRDSFAIVEANINEYGDTFDDTCKGTVPIHALNHCAIDVAPAVLRLLLKEVDNHFVSKLARKEAKNSTSFVDYEDVDGDGKFDFVMMMNANLLGGLLFSEIKMAPTITISTYQSLALTVEYDPDWSLSSTRSAFDRMDRIFLQRIRSIGLTRAFLRANRMRHSLGFYQLKRLKSPFDFFQPPSMVAMLAGILPIDSSMSLSSSATELPERLLNKNNNIYARDGLMESHSITDEHLIGAQGYVTFLHNMQPLLPPCTPCLSEGSSWEPVTNTTVILVSPPPWVSAKWTRSLIRAFSITKQSLAGYDECLFDRTTCRNEVVGFEVDWLVMHDGQESNQFPPVAPSFIHKEKSVSLLDSAIRNPNTVIAIINCDSESSALAAVGIEVVCISRNGDMKKSDTVGDLLDRKYPGFRPVNKDHADDKDSPTQLLSYSVSHESIDSEEIATQLLRVLRGKSIGTEKSTANEARRSDEQRNEDIARLVTSGLKRTVTIVRAAAQAHRENRWENLRDMQWVTSKTIAESLSSFDRKLGGTNVGYVNNSRDIAGNKVLHSTSTVLMAWIFFLIALFYLTFKESTVIKRWKHHRHHHHHRHGLVDEVLMRLSDLDDTWDMLSVWLATLVDMATPFSTDLDEPITKLTVEENPADQGGHEQQAQQNSHNSHNHYQGHVRRRRKTKATR